MNIPESIIKAARELVEQYGSTFDHLGEYKGQEAYVFCFPEDSETGFPFVYLLAPDGHVTEVTGFDAGFPFVYLLAPDGHVTEVTGFDALDIINALVVEDVSVGVVE